MGAHRQEDRVKAILEQAVDREVTPQHLTATQCDVVVDQRVDLLLHDFPRQAEHGDALHQKTSRPVVCLEDLRLVAPEREVVGRREAGRTSSDHGHLLACCERISAPLGLVDARVHTVGDKALEGTERNRLLSGLGHTTMLLAPVVAHARAH